MAKMFPGTEGLNPQQIIDMLATNADTVQDGKYFKKATPAEIQQAQERYAQLGSELKVFEAQKQEFMTQYKADTKPLVVEQNQSLELWRTKGSIEEGTLYNMINRTNETVETYNQQGELVNVRMAFPEELQVTNIVGSIREATNGGTAGYFHGE